MRLYSSITGVGQGMRGFTVPSRIAPVTNRITAEIGARIHSGHWSRFTASFFSSHLSCQRRGQLEPSSRNRQRLTEGRLEKEELTVAAMRTCTKPRPAQRNILTLRETTTEKAR